MLRLATDEDFNNRILRGLLRRKPNLDIVRVQDAGLHAEAREPPRGSLDLAASVDVVVAVGEHRRAQRDPHYEQAEIHLVGRHGRAQ